MINETPYQLHLEDSSWVLDALDWFRRDLNHWAPGRKESEILTDSIIEHFGIDPRFREA